MKYQGILLALSLGAIASPVWSGGFVTLPESDPLRLVGTNNPATDPLYLGDGWTPEANGYTRAARRISSVLIDGNDIGLFQDFVYRHTDGHLLFASQFTLEVEEQNGYTLEFNDIFRAGFAGYDVSAAWYGDDGDRLRSVAHSSVGRTRPQIPDVFSDDIVNMRTDVSIEEGNPSTAWYVIKTDATAFRYLDGAVSITQAAGSAPDFDPPFKIAQFEGFAPAPIPEPSEYAMLAAGLGILGVLQARRRRKA